MNKMKKFTRTFILSVVFFVIIVMLPYYSLAEYVTAEEGTDAYSGTYGGFSYLVVDGEVTITSFDKKITGSVVVPAVIDGYPVTAIGRTAFSECAITSVVLPDSIRIIGNGAFRWNYSLETVRLPASLISIGELAFYGCEKLSGLTEIPAGVKEIGQRAFELIAVSSFAVDPQNEYFCSFDGVIFTKDMSELVSFPCEKTGTFTIPASTKEVRAYSCLGSKISELIIPDNGIHISEMAFSTTGINSITIPGTAELEMGVFSTCRSLENVVISEGVEKIPEITFSGCKNLKTVSIPLTVKTIGQRAFSESGLTSIEFPLNIVSIESNAFFNCGQLTRITFAHDADDSLSISTDAFITSGITVPIATIIVVPDVLEGEINEAIVKLNWGIRQTYFEALYSYHRVNYYLDGGKNSLNAPRKYKVGDYAVLQEPYRYGYRFLGWFENGLFEGNSVSILKDGHTDVYAKWEIIPTCTVSFDPNGGTMEPDAIMEFQGEAVQIPFHLPLRDGFVFVGWSALKNESDDIYVPGELYQVNSDITLYAAWKKPDLELPSSLNLVDEYAFQGGKFSFVKIHERAKKVEKGAFDECDNLRYVEIDGQETIIDKDSFGEGRDIIIIGLIGGNAQQFADENGFRFVPLNLTY